MADFTSLFLLGCVVLVSTVAQIETRAYPERDQERYFANLHTANKFSCQPQPHSISVRDLVDVQTDEFFSPRMTVLHRCDHTTGCCKNEGESCRMKTEVEVELVFYVDKLHEKIGKGKNRRNPFRTVTAMNHTECFCGGRDR